MYTQQFENNLPPGISGNTEKGRLIFGSRGVDTVPYRVPPGQLAAVKEEDVAALPVATSVCSRVFDITNVEERTEYEQIRNAIFSKWFVILHEPDFRWEVIDGKLHRFVHIEYATRERILNKPENVM